MLVKLKEVYRTGTNYSAPHQYQTRDVLVNTDHIVQVVQNYDMDRRLSEGTITDLGADSFCTVVVSSGGYSQDMTVVGKFEALHDLISGRELLNG